MASFFCDISEGGRRRFRYVAESEDGGLTRATGVPGKMLLARFEIAGRDIAGFFKEIRKIVRVIES